MDAIGRDGVISVEKSQNFGIEVKILKGMMFDNGFISRTWPTTRRAWKASSPSPTSC